MKTPLCRRTRCRETRALLVNLERRTKFLVEQLTSLGRRDLPLGQHTECPACHTFLDHMAIGYGKEQRRYKIQASLVMQVPPCEHSWHRRKLVKALLATDFETCIPMSHAKEPTK